MSEKKFFSAEDLKEAQQLKERSIEMRQKHQDVFMEARDKVSKIRDQMIEDVERQMAFLMEQILDEAIEEKGDPELKEYHEEKSRFWERMGEKYGFDHNEPSR